MYIFSYCPFLGPRITTSWSCIILVIRNSKPCKHQPTPAPAAVGAARGPLASCSGRRLQPKVFGDLSFILFPTLLPLLLRQMPLAFKSQMYPCDPGCLVSVKAGTREKEPSRLLSR